MSEPVSMPNHDLLHEMRVRETEDLLVIWHKQDQEEWTPAAFSAIAQVLRERLGEAPTPDPTQVADEDEEPQAKPDRYHNEETLFNIAIWSNKLAWLILIVGILLTAVQIFQRVNTDLGYDQHLQSVEVLTMLVVQITSEVYSLLLVGFWFFALRGLSEGIYLLMDIRDAVTPDKTPDD